MPLKIERNDITKIECDAIVNAANCSLLGGGGVDGAIHKAAGKGLLKECMTLGGCKTGQAKITGAYNLPCRYVIHTVGPIWKGGQNGEEELLRSCYRESLRLAKENNCESVAFPLISSGVYGYPKAQALKIAVDEISDFLLEHEMLVYIVIFDRAAYQISEKLFGDIKTFIDENYVGTHIDYEYESRRRSMESMPLSASAMPKPQYVQSAEKFDMAVCDGAAPLEELLADRLNCIDESFSQMLLRKIDEKGITDAQCYKKANISRKLFSKIRGDIHYKPSKPTVIAFAISLELSLDETKDMLMKAGFALSHSNKFDIIIEYFITNGNYDVFEINQALFAFDQSLLGV
ncbi:MAG: O-acetyl-ADP-ribose deacetylase [Acutalibacteraceae bacterium]